MLVDIMPNPDQPRRDFDEEKLNELAASIREHGLIQPILVKPDGISIILLLEKEDTAQADLPV
jgi:ParB family chromosome partitioning protein